MKLFFDVVVKELKASTNIDFEKDLHSKTRDVVTTIEHDHIDSATPMDVDTHIAGIEEEKFFGECEEYGQTSGRSRQRAARPQWERAQKEDGRHRQVEGEKALRRSMLQLREDVPSKQRLRE